MTAQEAYNLLKCSFNVLKYKWKAIANFGISHSNKLYIDEVLKEKIGDE